MISRDNEEQRQEHYNISTNQVLMQQNISQVIYYLPCYVRLRVMELLKIDITEQLVIFSGTLLVSIYYGNLDRNIVEQFTGVGAKSILMKFCRQEAIFLKEDKQITAKNDLKLKRIDYIITQEFTCTINQDLFLTPFELINLHLMISFPTLTLNKDCKGRDIEIKINCMNSQKSVLIDHGQKTSQGMYSLATHFLEAQYTNTDSYFKKMSIFKKTNSQASSSTSKDDQNSNALSPKTMLKQVNTMSQRTLQVQYIEQEGVRPFQYAHFRVPIYKHPGTTLIEVYIPMWVLAFINLMVYFQDNVLAQKLGVITTIAVAFIAYIPFIKSAIPTTPGIKLMDLIIFVEVAMLFLTIFDAILTSQNQPETFVFDWKTNGWFITTLIIDIISIATILVMFVIHKLYWERTYIAPNEKDKQKELVRQLWNNSACDFEFKRVAKKRKITTL